MRLKANRQLSMQGDWITITLTNIVVDKIWDVKKFRFHFQRYYHRLPRRVYFIFCLRYGWGRILAVDCCFDEKYSLFIIIIPHFRHFTPIFICLGIFTPPIIHRVKNIPFLKAINSILTFFALLSVAILRCSYGYPSGMTYPFKAEYSGYAGVPGRRGSPSKSKRAQCCAYWIPWDFWQADHQWGSFLRVCARCGSNL